MFLSILIVSNERRPLVLDDEIDANYQSTTVDIPSSASGQATVHQPLTMSWQHVNANVDIRSRRGGWFKRTKTITLTKPLLFGVTGHATAGNIVAIMGSSGAGIDYYQKRFQTKINFRKNNFTQSIEWSSK